MNRWTGGVTALLAAIALAGCTPTVIASTTDPVAQTVEVVAVVDGDTIDVDTDTGKARVRLIGIDTPEIGRGGEVSECYAEEARTFLDELLYGQEVEMIGDATQAGVDKYTYDTAYEGQAAYRAAEDAAVAAGAGLWSACAP